MLRFLLRPVSHFKGRLMRHIFAKIMNIYIVFLGDLIFRSSYTCIYTVYTYLH